jgi:hypothetical protein
LERGQRSVHRRVLINASGRDATGRAATCCAPRRVTAAGLTLVGHVARANSAIHDAEFTVELLRELVLRYEGGPKPWRLEDLPPSFSDGLVAAVVAFQMPIDAIEAKFKLGQNRSAQDRAGTVAGLKATNTPEAAALAAFMSSEAVTIAIESPRQADVAKRIAALEGEARATQLACIRLETGIHQPEALGLYRSAGYRDCGPFGGYPSDSLSVFMEKTLGHVS